MLILVLMIVIVVDRQWSWLVMTIMVGVLIVDLFFSSEPAPELRDAP